MKKIYYIVAAISALGAMYFNAVIILTLMNMHYNLKCTFSSSSFLLGKFHHKDTDKERVDRANKRRVQRCVDYYNFSYKYRYFILGGE
jgi:hypothetical protein